MNEVKSWQEQFYQRYDLLEEINKELTDVGRRLHKDPYPMLSGVYISMLRGMLMNASNETFESQMNILRDVIKTFNMEYYKSVSKESSSGVFRA